MDDPSVQQCTILFVDVVGSTGLYESLGDERAKDSITCLQDLIATTAVEAGGRVHEIIGDELMICFDSASQGAAAAVAIQQATTVSGFADGEVRLAVRMGLHRGEAIVDGERMFGDMINVAARVAAIAQAGQIITTRDVVEQLSEPLADMARPFDLAPIRGKREPLAVYDLAWQPRDLTVISKVEGPADDTLPQRLTLAHDGVTHRLTGGEGAFSIGRDASSDLVIDWPSVSRRHATISLVRGRFVLADASTNGTYVTLQNGQTLFLRRESLPLWGKGRIALGAAEDSGLHHAIDYRCG